MKCDISVHVYMGYDKDNDAVEIDDNYFVPLHLFIYFVMNLVWGFLL